MRKVSFPCSAEVGVFLQCVTKIISLIQNLFCKTIFKSKLKLLDFSFNFLEKTVNVHNYLSYTTEHSLHITNNVPYNLTTRISVLVSFPVTIKKQLEQHRNCLRVTTALQEHSPHLKVITKTFSLY